MSLAPEFRRPAALPVANPCDLSPLDLAGGTMFGREVRPPLAGSSDRHVATVMDELLSERLGAGPTYVAFSGGRESSILLAAVTAAVRRHGLPDPVPITMRHTTTPDPEVARLQERVVSQLALSDWERVEIGDELEYVGPYARRALDEVGVTFPSTAYLLLPLLERARGGTAVLSVGPDDYYSYWHWSRISDVLGRRRRPQRDELAYLSLAPMPPSVRARPMRKRLADWRLPWLVPDAKDEALRLMVEEASHIPVRADRAIRRQFTHRCYRGSQVALAAMARLAGAELCAPYLDPRFLAASLVEMGKWGSREWTSAVLRGSGLASLPNEVLARSDEGLRHRMLFGEGTRDWVRDWHGRPFPGDELVDREALHAAWEAERVDGRSRALLLLALQHDRATAPASA